MSVRKSGALSRDEADRLPRDVAELLSLGEVRNAVCAFPGITGTVDSPFAVAGGNTLRDCLEEALMMVGATVQTLEVIAESCGKSGDVIGGCIFMLNAATAMLTSIERATDE